MKRYWLNRLTRQLGFQVVATGHHLDDETGRLLGNMIRGHSHHLDRQWPMLPAASHLARRIKPLCRLSGLEIRAYVQALDLKPLQAKCVKARGATLPHYQEAMTLLEQKMPGTKLNFYLGFLKSKGGPPALEEQPYVCRSCGLPAQAAVCAGCNLLEQAAKHQQEQTRPDPLQPSLFKLTVGRK